MNQHKLEASMKRIGRRTSHTLFRSLGEPVCAALLGACGGGGGDSAPAPVGQSQPAPAPTPAPPPPAAPASVPTSIRGTWSVMIENGSTTTLVLDANSYTLFTFDGVGNGSVDVSGEDAKLTFFNSNLCTGRGTYAWQLVEKDRLAITATPSGNDPCDGRMMHLDGRTYRRIQ